MAMAAPLPIPPRHPGRLAKAKSGASTVQATDLTSEQLDVWEHATVLYHGFDWPTSAETFLYLSKNIDRNLESNLCLLNAAMIFARCGDYTTAAQVLDDADPTDQTLALTLFLVGHVAFELGDYEKSEQSLRVALQSLNGSSQHFDRLRFDYILKPSHLQQSLRAFERKNEIVGMLGSLGALPADGVFEAPPRSYPVTTTEERPSTAASRSSIGSDLPTLNDSSSPSTPSSPIGSVRSLELAGASDQWHQLPEDPDLVVPTTTLTKPKAADANAAESQFDRLSSTHGTKSKSNATAALANITRGLSAPRNNGRLKLEPREARVQGDSVRGLADFIRELPSQNNQMQPKEAKVEVESTTALAEFFRNSGPEEAMRQHSYDDASLKSTSSGDSRIESVRSEDLRNLHNSRAWVQATPPPGRHPYRSGFGSMLTQENMPNSQSRNHGPQRREADFEAAGLESDSLYGMLLQGTGEDDTNSLDWPLTSEASRSLRQSFASERASILTATPASRRTYERRDIPQPLRPRHDLSAARPDVTDRTSSLHRQNLAHMTMGDARQHSAAHSTISSNRFFSHVLKFK